MKQKFLLTCAALTILTLSSCKKENAPGQNGDDGSVPDATFEGTWTFDGFYSQAKGVFSFQLINPSTLGKTLTDTTYYSKENSGTIRFSSGTATSAVQYSVDTTAYKDNYDNGTFYSSFPMPFKETVSTSGSVSHYDLVGTDSIRFGDGGLLGADRAMSIGGGHYSIKGNKMTISTSYRNDSAYVVKDVGTGDATESVIIEIQLVK